MTNKARRPQGPHKTSTRERSLGRKQSGNRGAGTTPPLESPPGTPLHAAVPGLLPCRLPPAATQSPSVHLHYDTRNPSGGFRSNMGHESPPCRQPRPPPPTPLRAAAKPQDGLRPRPSSPSLAAQPARAALGSTCALAPTAVPHSQRPGQRTDTPRTPPSPSTLTPAATLCHSAIRPPGSDSGPRSPLPYVSSTALLCTAAQNGTGGSRTPNPPPQCRRLPEASEPGPSEDPLLVLPLGPPSLAPTRAPTLCWGATPWKSQERAQPVGSRP